MGMSPAYWPSPSIGKSGPTLAAQELARRIVPNDHTYTQDQSGPSAAKPWESGDRTRSRGGEEFSYRDCLVGCLTEQWHRSRGVIWVRKSSQRTGRIHLPSRRKKCRRFVTFQRKPRPLGEMAKGVYD